jgi:hypothetical protein
MSRAAAKAASTPAVSPVGRSGTSCVKSSDPAGVGGASVNVRARSSHGLAYSSTRPKPLVTWSPGAQSPVEASPKAAWEPLCQRRLECRPTGHTARNALRCKGLERRGSIRTHGTLTRTRVFETPLGV